MRVLGRWRSARDRRKQEALSDGQGRDDFLRRKEQSVSHSERLRKEGLRSAHRVS